MEVGITKKRGMLKQLAFSKNYMLLFIANFISRFGDSIDAIAYSYMVYELTGSKMIMGALFAVNFIPNIVLSPFAGVIADRFNKKRLIAMGYLGRGIMVSITALMLATNILKPWHLFAFTFINSTFETLMSPATMSILPLIITENMYLTANSFSNSAFKFAELLGTAMAGIFIALMGTSGAIFIDGATFFIAFSIIAFMRVKDDKISKEKIEVKAYINDIKEGFSFVKNDYLIRTVLILFALMNFCLSPINVLMPAFVSENLKADASALSLIESAIIIGMILGGVAVASIGNKVKGHTLMSWGMIIFGVSYSLFYFPGNILSPGIYSIALSTFAGFLLGFMIPFTTSPMTTKIMINTEKSMMGRVGAFMTMVSCCAIPLGSSITGTITELLPMTTIFAIMGGIIILLGIRAKLNNKLREAA